VINAPYGKPEAKKYIIMYSECFHAARFHSISVFISEIPFTGLSVIQIMLNGSIRLYSNSSDLFTMLWIKCQLTVSIWITSKAFGLYIILLN